MLTRWLWFDEGDLFIWMQAGVWGNVKFYAAGAIFFPLYWIEKLMEWVLRLGRKLLCG